jgi:hypothetical protein
MIWPTQVPISVVDTLEFYHPGPIRSSTAVSGQFCLAGLKDPMPVARDGSSEESTPGYPGIS